ncbi:MAG: hypothetical protein ACRESZ_05890 [Methylococcales bacterium]
MQDLTLNFDPPRDGTLTAISAHISLTAAVAILGSSVRVQAQIYSEVRKGQIESSFE